MEKKLFDEMYELETQHWWFVARRKIIEKIIKSLNLKPDALILDTGCGNGDNLELLGKYGEVVAIEKNEDAMSRAKSRQVGAVFKGDLPGNIPLEVHQNYDLIVMLDVLEHIEEDTKSLSELKKWLDEDGKLLITVPAYQFLWSQHDELHQHKRRYTINTLKIGLQKSGWKIKYISYFNFFLFPLALIIRSVQKLFPPSADAALKPPNKVLNYMFERIFSFEASVLGNFSFPFGLSIIVLATKADI